MRRKEYSGTRNLSCLYSYVGRGRALCFADAIQKMKKLAGEEFSSQVNGLESQLVNEVALTAMASNLDLLPS